MSVKEQIVVHLDTLEENQLAALYAYLQALPRSKPAPNGGGIMERLRAIQFEGPTDFSRNLDQYLSGEKRVEDHLS